MILLIAEMMRICGEFMTTATVILILAILLLGGVIATVGDRLGTRVGKARLSLFNLRPRKTATLVTILTGTIISATTFGLLFALSGELRKGVFEYEKNQKRLRQTRAILEQTSQGLQTAQAQKAQIEAQLNKARTDQANVRKQLTAAQQKLGNTQKQLVDKAQQIAEKEQQLAETDRSLQAALTERTRAQADTGRVVSELSRTRNQLAGVSRQTNSLRSEINALETDRERLIAQRQTEIKDKELAIQEREERLQQLQARLGDLEKDREKLDQQIRALEVESDNLARKNIDLRSKSFAIQRGQVLGSAVIRVLKPGAGNQAVDRLLQEANRQTSRLLRFSNGDRVSNKQLILPARSEVNQLVQQIADGREYVLRVISLGNYLEKEAPIAVRIDAVENRQIFNQGDLVTSITVDSKQQNREEIKKSFDQLLLAAGVRAQLMGVVNGSLDIGTIQDVGNFLEQLQQSEPPVQIKAVAAQPIYAAGPLKLEFIAEKGGQVLFRTQ
jgi:uncharacterized protein (DUF3084 family)